MRTWADKDFRHRHSMVYLFETEFSVRSEHRPAGSKLRRRVCRLNDLADDPPFVFLRKGWVFQCGGVLKERDKKLLGGVIKTAGRNRNALSRIVDNLSSDDPAGRLESQELPAEFRRWHIWALLVERRPARRMCSTSVKNIRCMKPTATPLWELRKAGHPLRRDSHDDLYFPRPRRRSGREPWQECSRGRRAS